MYPELWTLLAIAAGAPTQLNTRRDPEGQHLDESSTRTRARNTSILAEERVRKHQRVEIIN